MQSNTRLIRLTLLSILLITTFLTGCGQSAQKKAPKQQSAQSEQESGKVPEQLKTIESSVEQIISTLNGPSAAVKEEKSGSGTGQGSSSGHGGQSNKGQDSQQGQKGQQSGQSSQQGEQSGQQGEQSGQQKQQSQQTDPWEKLTPIINDMHFKWNSYMPLIVKMGANKTLIDNFGNSLNSLTNSIISKNKTNTLLAASSLYGYIPDFYALSKSKTSPELKRIRHFTRNSIISSMTANWAQADSDIDNLKASWSLYKNALPKEQHENSKKLDFSVYELERVIKEKNQPLSDIKGRIALSNILSMEKAMGETSEKSEQSGGSSSQSGEGSSSGGSQSGGGSSQSSGGQ